jgi:hypothetical protein
MQKDIDHAMTLNVGGAIDILVRTYGLDGRTYTATFDDSGKWCISVRADNGSVIARFNQD